MRPTGHKNVLIFTAVVVLMLAGLYFYRFDSSGDTTLFVAPKSNDDTTASNWPIYRNDSAGFEIKYPEDLNSTETKKSKGVTITFYKRNDLLDGQLVHETLFSISILENTGLDKTLSNFINKNTNTSVAGHDALRTMDSVSTSGHIEHIKLIRQGKEFSIELRSIFMGAVEEIENEQRKRIIDDDFRVFEKMLTTFRFVN